MKKYTVKIEYDIYADSILEARDIATSNHDDLILSSKRVERKDETAPFDSSEFGDMTTRHEMELERVKRNKQVDVPTEAWQKDVERILNAFQTTIEKMHNKLYKE